MIRSLEKRVEQAAQRGSPARSHDDLAASRSHRVRPPVDHDQLGRPLRANRSRSQAVIEGTSSGSAPARAA